MNSICSVAHLPDRELQACFELMPIGVCWLEEGRPGFANSAFGRITGYLLEEEGIRRWLVSAFPGTAARRVIMGWYRDLRAGRDSGHSPPPLELNLVRPDGELRKVSLAAGHAGRRLVITVSDMTELYHLRQTEDERNDIYRATLQEATDAVLEREKAERASLDAAELLQKTFASLNESVFIVESGSRTILDVNGTVKKMFGYEREEIIGRQTSCLHLDDEMSTEFGRQMYEGYRTRGYFETTYRMRRKDGTVFETEHCVTPIKDGNGRIASHVCVVRDITDRVRSERILRELAREQGAILDNACIGITLVRDRTFIWTNPMFEEMFGYARQELAGLSTSIIYSSTAAYRKMGMDVVSAMGENRQHVSEMQLKRKNRSLFWARCYCKALDPANPREGTIWIVEDIQARREAEQALEEKTCLLENLNATLEERVRNSVDELRQKDDLIASQNRLLVDLAPEAIVVVDAESGLIVSANQKAVELFGCSRKELSRSNILRFYPPRQPDGKPPDVSVRENTERVLSGETLVIERVIRGHDADVHCEVRLVALPSPHRNLIRASFFDVTNRIQAQKELSSALASEHRLNEEQRQFMGLVSHELRTPLAIIDGRAQLLAMTACRDAECLQHARRILVATKQMSDLIHTCLAEERLCTAGWTPAMVAEDIVSLARDTAAHTQASTESHRIITDLGRLPDRYFFDPMLVRIMFSNLLDNAVKYSPGGGTIHLRGGKGENGSIWFEVEDQGVGIPSDQIEKAFNRFYRAWQVPEVAGAGLGLHIVKKIAELHGGGVTCTSQPGKGSRFTVTIHT